jgi:predicted nucleic acid-binding protein
VLIGEIELVPRLIGNAIVPQAVQEELSHTRTPQTVRAWIAHPPAWLEIAPTPPLAPLAALGRGERAAIALAKAQAIRLLLMDDRAAVVAAHREGLAVVGTLGLLDQAAARGLIDIAAVVARLKQTNFRYRPELLDALLTQHREKGRGHE